MVMCVHSRMCVLEGISHSAQSGRSHNDVMPSLSLPGGGCVHGDEHGAAMYLLPPRCSQEQQAGGGASTDTPP